MSTALTTFLFEAANFLLLATVLAWLFFRPVQAAVERRRAALQQEAAESASRLADAERQQAEIASQWTRLEEDLEKRRKKAQEEASQQADQILSEAREAAQREEEAATQRLAQLESAQQVRLGRVIAETAATAVDHLLRRISGPELDRALFAAVCQELEACAGTSLAPVRVESSSALDEADQAALLAALGTAADSAVFQVTEDLGTGLRVSTGQGLVDASSAGLAVFAARRLSERLRLSSGSNTAEEVRHV